MQDCLKYGRCWRAQFFPRLESENVSPLREWCPGFSGSRPSAPNLAVKFGPNISDPATEQGFKKKTRITSRSVSRHQGHYIMGFKFIIEFLVSFCEILSTPLCSWGYPKERRGTSRNDAFAWRYAKQYMQSPSLVEGERGIPFSPLAFCKGHEELRSN